ncbi:phosphate/phosphite/phosphonate ABC transporter substrate-binding protein [Nostoc sp. FACHB-110]|uniref:phosphate/phosphite/phosphonate ABC transporter substrate-binding protein n=1 Tax=Nostoc sp. FACHB-110 TaxID=2692834 RepID=UPI0016856CC9|nr:PhnD/SsuA/transferrin family substrate-binding protein [Nostoc sp. FACHB-110]MBD2439289.1 PhnD/SsuA/transferrin family substrate-binding protein [Nostoc sp. FACHB-110]
MLKKLSRRFVIGQLLLLIVHSCKSQKTPAGGLTIGVIDYGGGTQIINQYARFNRYLAEKTKARISLEPTFNENKAIERLESRAWSLVFAPPGIAAIAIARYQYIPIFPLVGVNNLRSILVSRQDSPIQNLRNLQGKKVALGELGSATGYYFPLYNLYGLTLAQVISAPIPHTVLELVAQGQVDAGAVSIEEYNLYTSTIQDTQLRILYTDPHYVPPGVVLIGSNVESKRQEYIRKIMSDFPSEVTQEAGYIPNATIPDYKYMISVVERVQLLTNNLKKTPVQLFDKTI